MPLAKIGKTERVTGLEQEERGSEFGFQHVKLDMLFRHLIGVTK